MSWLDEIRFDDAGLVPVVAQEAASGELLMLAYADRDALQRTVETGFAHYHSRSRDSLWKKGESSGHVQRLVELRLDCDGDAVVYRVQQTGPACHTMESSCFFRTVSQGAVVPATRTGHILARLDEILRDRWEQRPEGSYTTYLFGEGIDKILKKVGEEATEVVVAAKNGDADALASEAADLIFHLAVLLRSQGSELEPVWRELERRFGGAPRVPVARTGLDRSS